VLSEIKSKSVFFGSSVGRPPFVVPEMLAKIMRVPLDSKNKGREPQLHREHWANRRPSRGERVEAAAPTLDGRWVIGTPRVPTGNGVWVPCSKWLGPQPGRVGKRRSMQMVTLLREPLTPSTSVTSPHDRSPLFLAFLPSPAGFFSASGFLFFTRSFCPAAFC